MKELSTRLTRAKGGSFNLVPPDHDTSNEEAAYTLAGADWPGYFGIFYKNTRPTKNALENGINKEARMKWAR